MQNHYDRDQGQVTNDPPTAAFTFDDRAHRVTFDGSASSGPDGTIASYAWDFGDGQTGTGATPSHAYAGGRGTTRSQLTVTDNDGATDSVTKTVTSVAPTGPLATDNFGRTTSGGWGTADSGGTLDEHRPGGTFSVGERRGQDCADDARRGPRVALNSVNSADTDLTVKVSLDKLRTGGRHCLLLRRGPDDRHQRLPGQGEGRHPTAR